METATPMLRQYLDIKKRYPGTILFFRLGDFYEMFNEDAVVGSRELEITLTARQKDSANPIPMCGIPHHAASGYIARLVRKGYRVAICEQTEAPEKGVKLVRREVVKVITPGTAIDPQLVEAKDSVYLAAVCVYGQACAAAFLETSSGDFRATEFEGAGAWEKVIEEIQAVGPRELLFSPSLESAVTASLGIATGNNPSLFSEGSGHTSASGQNISLTLVPETDFDNKNAHSLLRDHFEVADLSVFGLVAKHAATSAAAACLAYARETQRAGARHISEIKYYEPADAMILDAVTLRNLEIFDPRTSKAKNSLFGLIDETMTGMGSRILRSWLARPSIKRSEIQTRLDAVTELTDSMLRGRVRFLLKRVSDLERLIGRLNLGNATPPDLLALSRTLSQAPEIVATLSDARSLLLQVLSENIFELPEVRGQIDSALDDSAPANIAIGGVIRQGYNAELDELREMSRNTKQLIAAFEDEERRRTGITNLKIRFNNVFGYCVEVSKGNASRVPDDYERRQTLTNAERYTTPQLRDWEQKVRGAEEQSLAIENQLFLDLRNRICNETRPLQSTARALATLDALCGLAETAANRNFVCPTLHDGDDIEIKNGRHPVVEAATNLSFVPNDVRLNNSTDRMLVITGANMGGKSTLLRQVAIIQILAQAGSFVPAASARLPIVDRVWTRVGASDDLASGRSTFMVEMTETATILHNATARSLVMLDEIGRGTSTFDGLSIAWAVAEYLHNAASSPKTMFATHYHELTELAENLPGAKNYQMTAAERDGEVVFLHKLQPGRASKSYGIAVARLAGLPGVVIERAKDVLEKLEKYELAVFSEEKPEGLAKAAGGRAAIQVSLFALSNEAAIDEIRAVRIEELTSEESKEILSRIKAKVV